MTLCSCLFLEFFPCAWKKIEFRCIGKIICFSSFCLCLFLPCLFYFGLFADICEYPLKINWNTNCYVNLFAFNGFFEIVRFRIHSEAKNLNILTVKNELKGHVSIFDLKNFIESSCIDKFLPIHHKKEEEDVSQLTSIFSSISSVVQINKAIYL